MFSVIKMIGRILTIGLLTTAGAQAGSVDWGDECDIELLVDVTVSKNSLLLDHSDYAMVEITRDSQLFVRGREVTLDDEQRGLLARFDADLRQTLPGVVELVSEGLELGLTAVAEVFYGITSKAPPPELQAALDNLARDVRSQTSAGNGNFYYSADFESSLETTMEKLEPVIEESVKAAVGDIVYSVGAAIENEDMGFFDGIEAFSTRMTNMGEQVERQVSERARDLEERSARICRDVERLYDNQEDLIDEVPELEDYRVFSI